MAPLRIGFVPEHFSTPLEFAKKHYGLDARLLPFPSGTGHMVTALQADEIDIGVGLTEGWIAALGKAQAAKQDAGFSVVGTYVETPLCWAISTGARRDELKGIQDLKGKKVGVSRIGSGSYVMSFVLADQQGWLDTPSGSPPFPVEVLNTFANLRDGVNHGTADFFMWEHFTSKRYYDNGEIKRIGDIYTPWSSWKIVAANHLLNPKNWSSGPNATKPVFTTELEHAMDKINKGVRHFEENQEEAVRYISTKLDYSEEDAREWLKTVRFAKDVKGVDKAVVDKTVRILQKADIDSYTTSQHQPIPRISTQKELELSFLDQQPHIRVYGRYYIIFSFPDLEHAEGAVETLRTGFKEVLNRFPYLAGTVRMPDTSSECLQVLYPSPTDLDLEASRIFTVSFDEAKNPDFDYDELAKTNFLPENFPANIFCPDLIKHHPGLDDDNPFAEKMTSLKKGPIPAFATHGTFIPGGFVLSIWFYHAIADGAGNAKIQQVWSEAIRSLNRGNLWRALYMPNVEQEKDGDASDATLARGALASLARAPSLREQHIERTWKGASNKHTQGMTQQSSNPLRKSPYKVITKMFRFSDSAINDLSRAASDVKKAHASHFAALAAVIWVNVIQARLPLLIASGNTKSTMAIVVDLRKRVQEPFSSADYLGNLVLSEMPSWHLSEQATSHADGSRSLRKYSEQHPQKSLPPGMTAPHTNANLPDLISFITKISDSVHKVDEDWVETHFHRVLTEPNNTQHAVLTFPNGPDLYITSWQHMGADCEWSIPGTGSTQPTAIRRAAWVSEGGIVVLPRKEDRKGKENEAYEVMISLAEEDMKAFEDGVSAGGWLVERQGLAKL
ncbi:hypothetical protein TW65_03933 [Stemphylium lycopersici]|uniref:Periplasmic binding protein-like II n=1 Tax=Stemphylium lycopersici TaxID=183478 RepID=A0A364N028_STELY|nr:hypothetical protein TW65_03933 [Stemphylium lycopersici]RAR08212.1 periplasmic binding protein-like II [Stemphylium lycopersici]